VLDRSRGVVQEGGLTYTEERSDEASEGDGQQAGVGGTAAEEQGNARARAPSTGRSPQISRYGFSELRTTPCLASNAHDDDNDDGLATLNAH
jgi:hypothetical protein